MAMTREEKMAYRRGFFHGSRKAWPEHKPPCPPKPVVRELMEAAVFLRDKADAACATLGQDDDFVTEFGPGIDRLDKAMEKITEWLMKAD